MIYCRCITTLHLIARHISDLISCGSTCRKTSMRNDISDRSGQIQFPVYLKFLTGRRVE